MNATLAQEGAKAPADRATSPMVSVIICTYNRANFVRDAVASIQAQVVDEKLDYEIIVVDNASSDDTQQVLEEIVRTSTVPIRAAYEAKPGVAAARNCAVREARGAWLAFFDDDQVADPHWLSSLLAMANEKKLRCVGGGNLLRLPAGAPEDLGPEWRGLLGESSGGPEARRYDRTLAPSTNNLLLHRSVLEEVGGFDENVRDGGDDTDLFRRIFSAGIDGWYTPRAFSFHIVPPYRLSEAYLRWKSIRHGGHIARRNWQDQGRLKFLAGLVARMGQAALVHLPRLLWAKLRGDRTMVLDGRCLLWRSEGYIRYAASYLAPGLFAQRAFFAGMEFRSEREMFAQSEQGS